MIIATDQIKDSESITLSILVKTGSRNESRKNNGISHFLEHMTFKGTKNRTAKKIAEEFDMIGGHCNAYTSRTSTVYYAKVLKNDVGIVIDIIHDMLTNSIFNEDELEKERQVILQELYMTRDTPDDIVFDYFQETAFKDEPLGQPILGTEEVIKRVNKSDLLDYYHRQYSTKNLVISAAGKLDDSIYRNIKNNFSGFSTNSVEHYKKSEYVGGELHIRKKLEQTQLILGFKGVSYFDDNFYDLQVLSTILGGGMSSRLFQEVREKRGLVYNISSFTNSYSETGIFGIYAALEEGNINTLIDIVSNEVHKLSKRIYDNEIERARSQIRASLLMSMESTTFRATRLCDDFSRYGRYITNAEILDRVQEINSDSLIKTLFKIFTSNNITVTSLGNSRGIYDYDKIKNMFTL